MEDRSKNGQSKVPGVYKLDCGCGLSYIGQTKRPVRTRAKEHIADVKHRRYKKSAICDHVLDKPNHYIRFDEPKILANEHRFIPRMIRESIEIKKYPNLPVEEFYIWQMSKGKPVITAKETTCRDCGCFANEERYFKNMKLNKCMKSPLTLCEIASEAVNGLPLPRAFDWSVEDVAEWISDEVGLPQYGDCFTKNQINGLRLLMLEDPSRLPDMNIQDFHHIRTITCSIRQNYSTELVEFSRSISLPPRKPLTHCTWFKSRTGPSWGVRTNWTRCDILRWMEIIMPEPIHLDHWDYVWYRKPDYPKVRYARTKLSKVTKDIPVYEPTKDLCKEYLVPRKFRILRDLTESKQMIWMEMQQSPKCEEKEENIATKERRLNNLMQKQIDLKGLSGKQLILARRRMPKPKFLP